MMAKQIPELRRLWQEEKAKKKARDAATTWTAIAPCGKKFPPDADEHPSCPGEGKPWCEKCLYRKKPTKWNGDKKTAALKHEEGDG